MTLRHLYKAAVATAGISVPTLFEAALGRLSVEDCDQRLERWSRQLLEQAQIGLEVEGLSALPADENFVVMSNHQSLYDIPVIFQALHRRVRMVTKQELFRIPLWGNAMRVAGFVEVDRHNHARAVDSMKVAADVIQAGTDVWIAPEGTRSRDGSLQPFRKGGFHLARETNTKILPLTIIGTREVLPAGGRKVHPGAKVRVLGHPPIAPQSPGSLEEL